jgi:hypothetical protein
MRIEDKEKPAYLLGYHHHHHATVHVREDAMAPVSSRDLWFILSNRLVVLLVSAD